MEVPSKYQAPTVWQKLAGVASGRGGQLKNFISFPDSELHATERLADGRQQAGGWGEEKQNKQTSMTQKGEQ